MTTPELVLEYVKALAWPATVIVLVLIFRSEIISILQKLKRAELPGGLAFETFPEALNEAKQLSSLVKKEAKVPKDRPKRAAIPLTEANARMLNVGLAPSPSGLEISYYRQIAQNDPVLALAGLRIELETMLRNLAKGFGVSISPRDSAAMISRKLSANGAITISQAQLLNSVIDLSNAAVHGFRVTRDQADEVLDIAATLRDQYVDWLGWGFPHK
jgi:hypothetical protein